MANKTINEALKALFIELGGDSTKLADNQKISDYIDDIAEELGALATDKAVFEFKVESDGTDYTLADGFTFDDIIGAFRAGKMLRLFNNDENESFYANYVDYDEGLPVISFYKVFDGALVGDFVVSTANESVTYTEHNT